MRRAVFGGFRTGVPPPPDRSTLETRNGDRDKAIQGVGNVSNPFDDESGRFVVLVNAEAQYSLWPAHIEVPGGWDQVGAEGSREECVERIDRLWTDMRPAGLVAAMESDTD